WCSPLPISNRAVKPSTVDDTAIKCGKVKKLQNITKTEVTSKEWLFCFTRLCTVEDTAGYAPQIMHPNHAGKSYKILQINVSDLDRVAFFVFQGSFPQAARLGLRIPTKCGKVKKLPNITRMIFYNTNTF
ncbi:hypothetical protein QM567_26415, partial [Flectobacillus roseus]|uniref:hypothetical protein n=1 Tax=Flectobacillus roseus TaxID=502259 RepID=UPI0024B83B40